MIKLKDISKSYGNLRAVDNLTLTVPQGELFCFLGPNGAGKTTTIKILTGLLHASSGEASINGHVVRPEDTTSKKIIGYIPDMPFIYERLTPSEFMQFTADLYNISNKDEVIRTNELLALFGLEEQRASLIKDLSHGMRQRLIYAAAFLHEPKVLFIDEPLIGLDPYTIRLIKDFLRQKTKEGMTIFLTTHILALAEDIADRIGIIMNGKLITLGTLEELRNQHGEGTLEEVFLKLTAPAKKDMR